MRRFPFFTALFLVLLTAPAAEAAFPGANGRIAFTRDASANEEIFTAQPDGGDERRLTTQRLGRRDAGLLARRLADRVRELENGAATRRST